MKFQSTSVGSVPKLAWCAKIHKSLNVVTLYHGVGVVVDDTSFVEGCWDGDFGDFDFMRASVMCGSGGLVLGSEAQFRGSSDRLSPLVSIQKDDCIYISNSIIFALTASEEELDPIYPYYPYDMIKIWRRGDHCAAGELPLKSRLHLRVHFGVIVKVLKGGSICYEIPNPGEAPSNYESYRATLGQKVKSVTANASDPKRETKSLPIASLTQGYDSSATCVLAKEAGCNDVFSIADSRSQNPEGDTGEENAKRLGMNYHEVDRWAFLNLPYQRTAELSLFALASYAPMAGAENLMKNKLLITGHRGDLVWGKHKMSAHNHLEHTWARMLSGVSMMEFRLRVGYFILAPAAIMERHNQAIHQITHSQEMAPWTINSAYDRPLARRIIEEGGLPRGSFARKKLGSGHYSFKYQPESKSPIMEHYGEHLKQCHQHVSALKYAWIKARYQMNQILWNKLSPNKALHVRLDQWQRLFPYLCNISPLKLKWDSAFTLQWAFHATKSQYKVSLKDD